MILIKTKANKNTNIFNILFKYFIHFSIIQILLLLCLLNKLSTKYPNIMIFGRLPAKCLALIMKSERKYLHKSLTGHKKLS